MTQEQKIIRAKLGLLELAKQLGNVRIARPTVPIGASTEYGRRPARALASRSFVDCRVHTLAEPLMR